MRSSQQEFMMKQLKQQLIKQMDASLAQNPTATFEDLLKAVVEAMTKEAKKNTAMIPLQALSEVIQHYYQTLAVAPGAPTHEL